MHQEKLTTIAYLNKTKKYWKTGFFLGCILGAIWFLLSDGNNGKLELWLQITVTIVSTLYVGFFGFLIGLVIEIGFRKGGRILFSPINWYLIIKANDKIQTTRRTFLRLFLTNLIIGFAIGIFFEFSILASKQYYPGLFLGLGFYFGIIIGVVLFVLNLIRQDFPKLIQINKPYQRFTASLQSMNFSILQHFYVRTIVSIRKYLPLSLVKFLNKTTECYILESDGSILKHGKVIKTGATWRFRHRILQDYFAELWVEEYENKNR